MGINAIAIDATDGSCGMLKIETQGDFEVSEAIKNLLIGTRVEPRPYQGRIVTKTVDMYRGRYVNMAGENEPNAKSIMIESPTGSGKTVMGLVAAKYLQSELRMEGRKLAVGWMAMRRNLLSQTAAENAMHCADNPNGKSIGVNNLFMVSMFQRSPDDLLAKRKEGYEIMLVTDECQHDAAESAAHMHNLVRPDYILGLSATPFRTDRVKLCFDKVIKDAGIHQLIQDGYLSKFHHYTIHDWNPETVAATYLREPERWGKSLFYFQDLTKCFHLESILKQHGVKCDVVTGDTDVERQLAEFRAGEIPALINCMKLTEGFDDPSLQTAFVRDSSKGPTMQMAGRVFRRFNGNAHFKPLEFKQVVQSKQTHWPIIRTAMPAQQFVWQEDSWRSLTINPNLERMNQNARLAIAQTEVVLPKFMLDRRNKKASASRRRR